MKRRAFMTTSAAALAGPLLLPAPQSSVRKRTTYFGYRKLTLFFHGLAAHVWTSKSVRVLIPNLKNHGHVYNIGPDRKTLRPLKAGTHDVSKYDIGLDAIPLFQDVRFTGFNAAFSRREVQTAEDNKRMFTEFVMPHPYGFHTCRKAIVKSGNFFSDETGHSFGPIAMHLVSIYIYKLPMDKPAGLPYPYDIVYEKPGDFKLHVYSEPDNCDVANSSTHAVVAWGLLRDLFKDFKLYYKDPVCELEKPPYAELPSGVRDEDLLSVFEPCPPSLGKGKPRGGSPKTCGALFINNM